MRTTGLIANRLADLGFDVYSGVGGHGVVGTLEGNRPGPVVAIGIGLAEGFSALLQIEADSLEELA